jgi:peptide/nickel transport system permease protein
MRPLQWICTHRLKLSLIWPLLKTMAVGLLTGWLAFVCLRYLLPPPSATLLSRHASASDTKAYLDVLGVNLSANSAYLELLKHYLHGNFGRSWVNAESVSALVWRSFWLSVGLTLPGTLLAHALAIGCALMRRSSWLNLVVQCSSASGLLVCALLAQWLVCGPLFAAFGMDFSTFRSYLLHVMAPTLALTLALFGLQFSYYKALTHGHERARVLLAARGLGLRGWRLTLAGMRPLFGGILTRMGSSVPMQLVGGGVIIEIVFAVPGIGRRGLDAALANDAPVLVAITVLSALLLSVGVAMSDALARALDPRLNHGEARLA